MLHPDEHSITHLTYVSQMSPEPGSTAQLLWSHPVLTSIQQQAASTAQLSLCSLSVVNMSSNKQNIAVLAYAAGGTLALQLLSVSPDSKEELETHAIELGHETRAEGSKKGSKWCCCLSRHGEVMIWRQGGTAHRWTLQKGLPADMPQSDTFQQSTFQNRHLACQLCPHNLLIVAC